MKIHLKQKHEYKYQHRSNKLNALKTLVTLFAQRVNCQRFFHAHHRESRFFKMLKRELIDEKKDDQRVDVWARARAIALKQKQKIKNREQRAMKKLEQKEINSWLRRTQWLEYFKSCDRQKLYHFMTKSNASKKSIVVLIWEAMSDLIDFCQIVVIKEIEIMMRLKTIRTKKHQTRYASLKMYMNNYSKKKYALPWKHMMMFFHRLKCANNYTWIKRSRCSFNKTQKLTWRALIRVTKRVSRKEQANSENESDSSSSIASRFRSSLNEISLKLLNFVIILLNQAQNWNEFQCALICAFAMLKVDSNDYLKAKRYSLLLNKIIKINRFMIM